MNSEVNSEDRYSDKNIARSAFKVTIGNVLNLLVGVGSQMLVAAYFGAGVEMDAFFTAIVVPTYLQAVLLGGLSFVFIPEFIRASMERREESAWQLVGTFVWLTSAALALVALAGFILSNQILSLSAPGLSPSKSALAGSMLRIMILSVPFAGLETLTGGIQNARNRFLWPAFAPAIGALGNFVLLIVLYNKFGPMALAWGFTVSAILRASVNALPVLRHGWSSLIPLRDKRVVDLFKLIVPFLLFGLFTRSTELFERLFASGLPDGELSYIGYASKIARSFGTILRSGIVVAIFPAMAASYVKKHNKGLVERTEFGIRVSMATSFPAFAMIVALSVPLIMVLYERQEFLHSTTLNVSMVLPFITFREVITVMLGNILVRGFYVTKDTRTAPLVSTLISILYIVVAYSLVKPWGFIGLSIAKPITASLSIFILSLLLIRKLKHFHLGRLIKDAGIYSFASLLVFFLASFISNSLSAYPPLFRLISAGSAGTGLYLVILSRFDPVLMRSILEMVGVNRLINGLRVGYFRLARITQ